MKPEEQRIVIAEVCGWKFHPPCYNEGPFSAEFKAEALACWVRPGNMQHQTEYPPDYLNDLNAMHEAILTISSEKKHNDQFGLSDQDDFILYLERQVKGGGDQFRNYFGEVNATAAQRAEAFLRTLNLYTP